MNGDSKTVLADVEIAPEAEFQTAEESGIRELIECHYQLQTGSFISECSQSDDAIMAVSEVSGAPMWNHIAWLGKTAGGLAKIIDEMAGTFAQARRRLVVYATESAVERDGLAELLARQGYEQFDREVWMVLQGEMTKRDGSDGTGLSILQARTREQIEAFATVFAAAYGVRSPAFSKVLINEVEAAPRNRRVAHFVGYVTGNPVAIATLIEREGKACIYNVGTLPSAQRRGFGKAMMEALIDTALTASCRRLFLQVEAGSGAQRLYSKLGFKPVFARVGFRACKPVVSVRETRLRGGLFLCDMIRNWPAEGRESLVGESLHPVVVEISKPVRDGIENLRRRIGVSKEAVCSAAVSNLLSRYTGESEVAFGVIPSVLRGASVGSPQEVRIQVPAEMTVESWIQNVESEFAGAQAGARSQTGQHPRQDEWDVVLDFSDGDGKKRHEGERSGLRIAVGQQDALARVEFYRNPEVCSRTFCEQVGTHLVQLIEGFLDEGRLVKSVPMLSAHEQAALIDFWNEAEALPLPSMSVIEAFVRQAEANPDTAALLISGTHLGRQESITYGELHTKSGRLARYLKQVGVGPDVFVGICIGRSKEMIIALLAVMKAGGTFVPLDPSYPPERLAFIVNDARLSVVLTCGSMENLLPENVTRIVDLADGAAGIVESDSIVLEPAATEENLAYIIYTSGSTGVPKGVLITNGAIARHCHDCKRFYGITTDDRVLQFSSLNFDAALEQIFTTLISGACLVMRGPEVWTTGEFNRRMSELGLTVVDIPTAYWHQLTQAWAIDSGAIPANRLRLMIVGGEAMLPETLKLWRRTPMRHVRLLNAYGPTETTITATAFEIRDEFLSGPLPQRIPIGRPREGRRVYIVDRFGSPVPSGAIGELCIGGDLLARGYLNRPDMTKAKFVDDPFSPHSSARLYRTGDLVRCLPDGNLEFFGRIDNQVKIRGYRIELGEIETLLHQHPGVKEAAVTVWQTSEGEKRLAAYFVRKAGEEASRKELRYFLTRKLPEHMIPAALVEMEALPVLPSGKVDRRALPEPACVAEESQGIVKGPSDPAQLRLQLLYEKVLNQRPVGVDVSFFELGGDSLQALELLVEAERAFGRSIPLEALYQHSTIEGLAGALQWEPDPGERSSLVPLQTEGSRPPLFLIHTTPGDILGYGNLIYHLSDDQPCYGFQSVGLCHPEMSHQSIEDMAAHYVRLLREFAPCGPYYLGGWCYGAIVAVEMAHQLLELGQRVELLALMEAVALPPPLTRVPYHLFRIGCLLRMKPRRWLRYFQEKLRYRQEFERARLRFRATNGLNENDAKGKPLDERLARMEHVYFMNLRALDRYRSRFYPGRVTLFNAAETDPALIDDPYYGWRGLAREIEIHSVPGNHDRMLAEPHVRVLAQELEACLRRPGTHPPGIISEIETATPTNTGRRQ